MTSALLVSKVNGAMPINAVRFTNTLIEIDQVRAASQQNVLAIVQKFAGLRIFERTGAAPKNSPRFKESDIDANRFQRHRRRHSGKAASDNNNAQSFDVGCSMLDVRCWMFDVVIFDTEN